MTIVNQKTENAEEGNGLFLFLLLTRLFMSSVLVQVILNGKENFFHVEIEEKKQNRTHIERKPNSFAFHIITCKLLNLLEILINSLRIIYL